VPEPQASFSIGSQASAVTDRRAAPSNSSLRNVKWPRRQPLRQRSILRRSRFWALPCSGAKFRTGGGDDCRFRHVACSWNSRFRASAGSTHGVSGGGLVEHRQRGDVRGHPDADRFQLCHDVMAAKDDRRGATRTRPAPAPGRRISRTRVRGAFSAQPTFWAREATLPRRR
jgi:hypothetical protein